jgi:hypothetical protein
MTGGVFKTVRVQVGEYGTAIEFRLSAVVGTQPRELVLRLRGSGPARQTPRGYAGADTSPGGKRSRPAMR